MEKTKLILLQEDISSRLRLLKRFNGNPDRIKELSEKNKALSDQIKRKA